MTHHFPKENGHWFSIVQNPLMNENLTADVIINHQWPDAGNIERIKGLREKALQYRKQGKLVMLKGLCP